MEQENNYSRAAVRKVAIVGLPNTGKTHVFNNLTGEHGIVANYPGTTVEMQRSLVMIQGQRHEIIDTPSMHSLYIHSEEEVAVRSMILVEKPDVLVQCMDAGLYRQSLLLTAELLELEIPMVLVLNTMDDVSRQGIQIDFQVMEKLLNVPVLASMSLHDLGKKELKAAIGRAKKGVVDIKYGFRIEHGIHALTAALPFDMEFKHKIATLLLQKDPLLEKFLEGRMGAETLAPARLLLNNIRSQVQGNWRQMINDRRNKWADKVSAAVLRKQKTGGQGVAYHLTQASRQPFWGILIFLCLMALVYLAVVYVSGAMDRMINFLAVGPLTRFIAGFALPPFWNDFLIGNHGVLTLGLFNAVGTVLPILSVFFFIFGCFEDSGYIINFTVLTKNFFKKIGVPGHAITSLVLGFGCKTMATLSTRGLTIRKEKFIAVFLIAFAIPCSAQLGISMSILARVGLSAFFIVFSVLILCEIGAGLFLNTIIKGGEESWFIQAVPPLRFPGMKAVARKTYHRMTDFLKEALPIFLLSALGLFVAEKAGLLGVAKQALTPIIVDWMGLPKDILDVFLLALARREAAAGLILKMVDTGALTYIQSIIAVVVTTISFPCVANVMAIGREMGWKTAVMMTALIFVSSFFLVAGLRWILVICLGP
ncbi:MAG: ferrous iron transporter B [Candidatus Omnitrophota bacterium]